MKTHIQYMHVLVCMQIRYNNEDKWGPTQSHSHTYSHTHMSVEQKQLA